ncbi:hypothetical protein [Clostridium sp.]|uniref:hypothetical protein n=1 Tax=Clostridium sp. TaxID=1506 RepID=UPI001A6408B4|nr:hypothetical protein [Clostridium sp.]MBK5234031.1 hypothetical protein [Clostridium sp.]
MATTIQKFKFISLEFPQWFKELLLQKRIEITVIKYGTQLVRIEIGRKDEKKKVVNINDYIILADDNIIVVKDSKIEEFLGGNS